MDSRFFEQDWLRRHGAMIEQELARILPARARPSLLDAAMRTAIHQVDRRPALMLLAAAHSLGGCSRLALRAAVAVQLWQARSLSLAVLPELWTDHRHGSADSSMRFDERMALIAGHACTARAFEVLAESGQVDPQAQLQLSLILAQAIGSQGISGAQADLCRRGNVRPSPSDMRDVGLTMAATIFVAAMKMALVCVPESARPAGRVATLEALARDLSIASRVQEGLFEIEAGESGSMVMPEVFKRRLASRIVHAVDSLGLKESPLGTLARAQCPAPSVPSAERTPDPYNSLGRNTLAA